MKQVVVVGAVVPFDVGELAVVAYVFVGEAAIQQHAGDTGMLGFVGCVKWVCVVVQPNLQLFLWRFLLKMRWRSPGIGSPAKGWSGWIAGL